MEVCVEDFYVENLIVGDYCVEIIVWNLKLVESEVKIKVRICYCNGDRGWLRGRSHISHQSEVSEQIRVQGDIIPGDGLQRLRPGPREGEQLLLRPAELAVGHPELAA